jgi:hypothetical protein
MTAQDFNVRGEVVRADALRLGDYIVRHDAVRLVRSVAYFYDADTFEWDDQQVVLNLIGAPRPEDALRADTLVTRLAIQLRD